MTYISKNFINKILEESHIEQIIGDYVQLKKAGANLKGLSPFVDERTPSFMVSPSKGIWKDFSTGKGGASSVSFIMEKTGCSFPDAIKMIASKMGLEVEYEDTREAKAHKEKIDRQEDLRPVLRSTIRAYNKLFNELPEDHPAKVEIFQHRGYTQEIVDSYGIGFAPGKNFLTEKLTETGTLRKGQEISLATEKGDFFFNRVVYPIFDKNGRAVAMAGRDLSPEPKIKWLNSRENVLYDKSRVLYGLNIGMREIRKNEHAYIVEGYNDVISMQSAGLLETVAPCGTGFNINQVKLLARLISSADLCFDNDQAGHKAAKRIIPELIRNSIHVFVRHIPGDPDEFVRSSRSLLKDKTLKELLDEHAPRIDGFKILLDEIKDADPVSKSSQAKELCKLLADCREDSITNIYAGWLAQESDLTRSTINGWIKEFKDEIWRKVLEDEIRDNEYRLPDGVTHSKELIDTVKKYQMFQAKNQIWVQHGTEAPFHFKSVSNFRIEIIQHMQDEKFPKKLVSVLNVHDRGYVFDVPSDTFNKTDKFTNAVTNFGNFRWIGRHQDLQRLQAYLFDSMGNGRSIDVLGWQNEGFFLFNNLAVVPGQENIVPDENGCFVFNNTAYYVPSANSIYKDNVYKYTPQKRFRHMPGKISPGAYFSRILRVHGKQGISAILFAMASLFHDVVSKKNKGFPILFLYGPPGTGKDELNYSIQSLFGEPQEATNLEGGNSTATANIRELAQFQNTIIQWSEYARGDSKLDGTIKSLWDLRGKKTGNIESRVATDNIPVLAGVALTGNEYPDSPAVITRVVWNDMDKNEFSEEDEREFNELQDIIDQGVTHITVKLLESRFVVEESFTRHFRNYMDLFQARLPDCNKRMLKNISTLATFYNIFKDEINFPFTLNEMVDYFVRITENQMRKLTSSSIISRFWDCFLASMRGTMQDRILVGREIKLEGTLLYFQFTHCYNKIQRQWFTQYRDSAPPKQTLKESIRKDSSYHKFESSVRFAPGQASKKTSAEAIEITRLPGSLPDLIKSEIEIQERELNSHGYSPVTPNGPNDKSEGDQEKLPF